MLDYLLAALGLSLVINLSMFALAYRYTTDKLTDVSYALSFVVLAFYALLTGPASWYGLVLFGAVAIWALRLGGFLLRRVWNKGKDKRFDDIRGSFWKFGRFWAAQALAVWIILIPVFWPFATLPQA